MNKNELSYLDTIFKAVPLMSEFDKGRLLGYAEALIMKPPAGSLDQDSAGYTYEDTALFKDSDDDAPA